MFDGKTYEPEWDKDRLQKQLKAVKELMLDQEWRTLFVISKMVGAPESSVSARLRDLRKEKFGSYNVERRYQGAGIFEYRVSAPWFPKR